MTTRRRSSPMRACHGKKLHAAEQAAREHLARLVREGAAPGALETYPCRWGPHWHVGHRIGHRGKR